MTEAVPSGTGILLLEIEERLPDLDEPRSEDSAAWTVELRMLDHEGRELWRRAGTDIGADLARGDAARLLRVLDDVVLVHTAPGEVTALDASTGSAR